MVVVEIVPLSRKMPFDTLLYTSGQLHSVGDLATAPFQESEITGIIIGIHQIGTIKSHLRSLNYKIRDGVETVTRNWLSEKVVMKYIDYAATQKANLSSVFGLLWHEDAPLFDSLHPEPIHQPKGIMGSVPERIRQIHEIVLSTPEKLRIYIVPDMHHAHAITQHLQTATIIKTIAQLKKIINKNLRALDSTVILPNKLLPALVPYLPLGSTIIFDGVLSHNFTRRDKSGDFFSHASIYVDMLSHLGHRVIIGDELLPFGDWKSLWNKDAPYIVTAPKVANEATQAKHKRKKTLELHHLKELVNHAEHHRRVLMYCNQRDISGYVLCHSCHHIERCESCNSIMRLALHNSRHILRCQNCHTESRARDLCPKCGGVTLQTRRQGIDGYANQLRELSPTIQIYTYTRDTRESAQLLRKWIESDGILISTSALFSHPELSTDITYITPSTWTWVSETPEDHLYEYLWLLHRSQKTLSLPITREILTLSTDMNTIDITTRAKTEFESAKVHNIKLPKLLL